MKKKMEMEERKVFEGGKMNVVVKEEMVVENGVMRVEGAGEDASEIEARAGRNAEENVVVLVLELEVCVVLLRLLLL